MKRKLIIGLDIGTTTCKTAVFDLEMKGYHVALTEYGLSTPETGWIELDPKKIWDSVTDGIAKVLSESGYGPRDVIALSYSVLGCAVAPINKDGDVLYPFIEGWDARDDGYKRYFRLVDQKLGLRTVFDITGNFLTYGSLNKILWIRENKKQIYKNTWKFLCVGDYITYKLTGKLKIDYSMASNMIVFDNRRKVYSDRILDSLKLDEALFAETVQAGTVVGEITEDASRELGIGRKTVVIAGSHDQTCAALGVGNIKEGIVSDGLGTVECVGITTDEMNADENMYKSMYPSYPHAVAKKYFSFGVQLSSGLMLKWYKDIFCRQETQEAKITGENAYNIIIREAKKSPVGSRGILVLPHLRGGSTGIDPPLNMTSKSAVIGLDFSHKKSDITRAILEGVAFESRVILEGLKKNKIDVKELRATGGGTKSTTWLQIRADILNKKIHVPKFKDAGLLGAIILAAKGVGFFSSYESAIKELVEIENTIYPQDEKIHKYYTDIYYIYKQLYPSLTGINKKISEKRGQ